MHYICAYFILKLKDINNILVFDAFDRYR